MYPSLKLYVIYSSTQLKYFLVIVGIPKLKNVSNLYFYANVITKVNLGDCKYTQAKNVGNTDFT